MQEGRWHYLSILSLLLENIIKLPYKEVIKDNSAKLCALDGLLMQVFWDSF